VGINHPIGAFSSFKKRRKKVAKREGTVDEISQEKGIIQLVLYVAPSGQGRGHIFPIARQGYTLGHERGAKGKVK